MSAALTRIWAFVRKEIISVLRQPRLVVTLILGPFLILVLFGVGYRDRPPAFRTELVLPSEQAQLASEDMGEAFGSGIEVVGTSTDVEAARERLRSGEVDLLIIAPSDALLTIEQGERAEFLISHRKVDPVIRATIDLLSRLSIDEINRRIVARVIDRAQAGAEVVDEGVGELQAIAGELVAALEGGDRQRAEELKGDLGSRLGEAEQRTASDDLYDVVAEALGTAEDDVSTLEDDVSQLDVDDPAALDRMRQVERAIAELETQLDQARGLEPDVLASPFAAEVEELALLPATLAAFYAPGALALLIQHLAVTFAALSLVRERELGLAEVFRVSPLGVSEVLIGKYLAFTLLAGSVAAVLTGALLAFGASLGDPWAYAGTILLVILGSLGLGFLVSAVAQTDTQAVQYSMIVLLVSIFFTGFVLALDQLILPVRVISFLLPATYGIIALHDLMFRAVEVHPFIWGGLGAYVAALAVVAWWAIRKDVAEAD